MSWLKGGTFAKGPNSTSLNLKVVTKCGNPKLLANVMKSYPSANNLNTRDCDLEGSELFGYTKQKFDLSPNVDCNLHQHNKMNYSTP